MELYAWISPKYVYDGSDSDVAFIEPVEEPRSGDRLFIAGRNRSLTDVVVSFECLSTRGKIVFDKSDEKGIFCSSVELPNSADYDPVVGDDSAGITLSQIVVHGDFVKVKSRVADVDAGAPSEAHNRTLAFRF